MTQLLQYPVCRAMLDTLVGLRDPSPDHPTLHLHLGWDKQGRQALQWYLLEAVSQIDSLPHLLQVSGVQLCSMRISLSGDAPYFQEAVHFESRLAVWETAALAALKIARVQLTRASRHPLESVTARDTLNHEIAEGWCIQEGFRLELEPDGRAIWCAGKARIGLLRSACYQRLKDSFPDR